MENQTAHWWVARTRHGREIRVRDRLKKLGIKNFVPTFQLKASRGNGSVELPPPIN